MKSYVTLQRHQDTLCYVDIHVSARCVMQTYTCLHVVLCRHTRVYTLCYADVHVPARCVM
jgi:hypothetical protein